MFPWVTSSTRDRVEPATSGTESPAAGADGDAKAAGGGREVASMAAVLTPGEAPTPVLPGAAPSCGPVEGPAPGEDVETPGGPPTDGSMMFWRRTAYESNDEFAVSLLLSSTSVRPGPHSLEGRRQVGSGWAARRSPAPRGRPRRCRRALVLRGARPAAVVWWARPLHHAGWRPAWQQPGQGPRRCKRSSLARHRKTGSASSLAAALPPT